MMESIIDSKELLLQLASSRTIGDEAAFVYPDVLQAISVCSRNQIAVLGVEMFRIVSEVYSTEVMSSYDLSVNGKTWLQFVEDNNREAMSFITDHRVGNDHFYVLTAASRQELSALQN